ncbi:MAG: ABC transporter substrate-binding protein [Clostridia bacterium]|nr:ABC transporter substrate-binding protein [Clostridia bacterium]
MKKLVSLVLALCMLLSVVAVASAEEKVVINVWRKTFNLAQPDQDQVKKVEAAINEYIADKINVQIVLTDMSGEYEDQAKLAMANNEIDLLWTASWESVIGTNDLVPANAVADITDYLPGTALYASMAEGQWEATKYSGRNYFIPVYKDNVEGYNFMFRKELVDQFGWDVSSVKTLADAEPFLVQAKEEAGIKYPYLTQKTALFYRWNIDAFDFFTADASTNFFAVDRDTNEVVNVLASEEYVEFCKLMGKWGEMGLLHEDDLTKVTTDTTTQSKDWALSYWTDLPDNTEANARYGQEVVMVPATNNYAHSTSALGSCYAVTTMDETKIKACIDFMGLLYTDSKLADMYTFGIEGEDFTYTQEEGQTVVHVTQTSEKYNHSMWESASATIVTPLAVEPDNKADLYIDFNGGAITSCAAGFRFDRTPVEAEYVACQALFDQYGFVLENGGVPADAVEDYIAQYQADLDAAGFQTCLAEFQNQYNAWKAQ